MEDLEDDISDQVAGAQPEKDLFADDDDDEDYAYNNAEKRAVDEETEEEAATQPASAVEAPLTADDRRAALLKLAQKKRKETEGGDSRKKKKLKKGSSKDSEKGSKETRKSRREARTGPDAPAGADGEPELLSDADDLAEDDPDDFIDDEGVPIDERDVAVDDDDEGTGGLLMQHEEAVEVAPGEEDEADDDSDPFGKKKRKKRKETDQQMAMVVDDKIAKMEAAAEADMEEHEQSRPAIQKLKILAETEDFLAQKKYHELFVSAGGLGVLKAWLEPYSDGSLPNTRIRSAVLRACKLLPIDTSREDMKSQLKKSQLGNRVMFLLKCQDETTANRQLARELVQQWSRPIFHDPQVEAEKRRIREQQLKVARAAAIETQKDLETQQVATQKPKVKYGETGYRWHASIPQASKLDYVMQPVQDERVAQTAAAAAAVHVPANASRFAKKMREVQRKQKSTTARAAKPSVEGRTITLMHT